MDEDRLRALRSEYEAGILSEEALAAKYGTSISRIRVLAVKKGWNKRKPPSEEKVLSSVHLFSFDPSEQAVLSAAQVVSLHRKDVARLRDIASTLVDRLGLELAGKLLPDPLTGHVLPCRGSRESPADLLEKLSRVMVRTTEIERQAYGLRTFSPEAEATDAQLQEELDRLTEQLERAATEKANHQ
jgi:hypothetical protein